MPIAVSSSPSPVLRRLGFAAGGLLLAGLLAAGWRLHADPAYSRAGSWALFSGAVFGFVLQRSRFCFYCGLREFIEERDARPVLGLLAALAAGTLGYFVILGAWVPFPDAGYPPPRAHVGPAGWHLLLGGLSFGGGMALSGSCLSAHFYRLGEGSLLAPLALLGAFGGFILGFNTWEFIYLRALTHAPVLWLPAWLGYSGAAALQLAVLGGLAFWAWRRGVLPAPRVPVVPSFRGLARAILVERWPHWIGGSVVGLLATATYLRSTPLGVTGELGRLARKFGREAGLVPVNLPGLDEFPGCATGEQTVDVLFTPNALFVLGLIAAALVAGLAAGQFRPERPTWPHVLLALVGGVLLGFGAMISLGCSIGTLLSGVQAFAVSGWIFGVALVGGVYGGLKIRRALGQ